MIVFVNILSNTIRILWIHSYAGITLYLCDLSLFFVAFMSRTFYYFLSEDYIVISNIMSSLGC